MQIRHDLRDKTRTHWSVPEQEFHRIPSNADLKKFTAVDIGIDGATIEIHGFYCDSNQEVYITDKIIYPKNDNPEKGSVGP